ncbi:hypothetical protein mRhiFer1_009473 [Rhinolophus ferrumequinum]|uniref:Uncharacterized protein n=1 Tax=Rhinolophus ferrumequinum TaxID=59479 RepID=A0A7J7REU3_RHIFE|nr:hypothetical protein mRhiFer1_009473 [Rhinolophus ferrumequinum]
MDVAATEISPKDSVEMDRWAIERGGVFHKDMPNDNVEVNGRQSDEQNSQTLSEYNKGAKELRADLTKKKLPLSKRALSTGFENLDVKEVKVVRGHPYTPYKRLRLDHPVLSWMQLGPALCPGLVSGALFASAPPDWSVPLRPPCLPLSSQHPI